MSEDKKKPTTQTVTNEEQQKPQQPTTPGIPVKTYIVDEIKQV